MTQACLHLECARTLKRPNDLRRTINASHTLIPESKQDVSEYFGSRQKGVNSPQHDSVYINWIYWYTQLIVSFNDSFCSTEQKINKIWNENDEKEREQKQKCVKNWRKHGFSIALTFIRIWGNEKLRFTTEFLLTLSLRVDLNEREIEKTNRCVRLLF